MAKEKAELVINKGDKVNVVLASGALTIADVVNVRKGNKLDVSLDHNAETIEIHSSPLDPTGKQPDSWHPIPAKAPEKAETPAK